MFCRSCGKEVSNNAVACPGCGCVPRDPRGSFCPGCGSAVTPGAAVCLKCGGALASIGLTTMSARPQQLGKVVAMGIIFVVSGAINILLALYLVLNVMLIGLATMGIGCLLIVWPVLPIVTAVFEIMHGIQLLGNPPKRRDIPIVTAILELICILACNPMALVAGILALVFRNDPEVISYLEGEQRDRFPVQMQ